MQQWNAQATDERGLWQNGGSGVRTNGVCLRVTAATSFIGTLALKAGVTTRI